MDDAQYRAYTSAVLGLFGKGDVTDEVFWRADANDPSTIRFFAMCSDFFAWGCADSEEILPNDVPLLEQCMADLKSIDVYGGWHRANLFSARKRGMRPMRAWLNTLQGWEDQDKAEKYRELYVACGPERDPRSEG